MGELQSYKQVGLSAVSEWLPAIPTTNSVSTPPRKPDYLKKLGCDTKRDERLP